MKLYSIETGRFRLDGGAMFGVVPKPLWERTNPADERNRIDMAMRCLLVETGDRLVLVDAGLGHKYDAKFAALYGLDDRDLNLQASLKAAGFAPTDVTDLVLTHLHFDHCGGCTWRDADGQLQLTFPNATHYVQRKHLVWAQHPNARERASFFAENIQPIAQSSQLRLLDGPTELLPGFRLEVVHGHTEAQQLPILQVGGHTILFAADLFPTFGHLPLPYVMGYDTRPLITLEERAHYLDWCAAEGVFLFYEHDPYHELGTVVLDDRGRYGSGQTLALRELLGTQ